MSAPGYKWECSSCTYTNLSNARVCEMCARTVISNPKRAIITPPKEIIKRPAPQLNGKECTICYDNNRNIIKIPCCHHRICYTCIKKHFSLSTSFNCPVCKCPSIKGVVVNDPKIEIYLDDLLKILSLILDKDHLDSIKNRLETRKLAIKSNFRRCVLCNNGYTTDNSFDPIQLCTSFSCQTMFCYSCKVSGQMKDHNCTTYKMSLLKQPPDKLFEIKNFIKCPTCQYHEMLSDNGCLHVKCSDCEEEYCSFCNVLYTRDKILGLDAKHNRNCWNYLRDKELADLKLLCNSYELPTSYNALCNIKYTNDEKIMVTCNNNSISNYGICESHFKKYLAILCWYKHN